MNAPTNRPAVHESARSTKPDPPVYENYRMPLSGGRALGISLAVPLTPDDLRRLRAWIDLMEPVLLGDDDTTTTEDNHV